MSDYYLGTCVAGETREDLERKVDLKEKTIQIHDLYVRDMASAVSKGIPTFLIFAPQISSDKNEKSIICFDDKDSTYPDGVLDCFIAVDILHRHTKIKLDGKMILALCSTKMVNVRNDGVCCFLSHPVLA